VLILAIVLLAVHVYLNSLVIEVSKCTPFVYEIMNCILLFGSIHKKMILASIIKYYLLWSSPILLYQPIRGKEILDHKRLSLRAKEFRRNQNSLILPLTLVLFMSWISLGMEWDSSYFVWSLFIHCGFVHLSKMV